MKPETVADRLIVAADFKTPNENSDEYELAVRLGPRLWVQSKIVALADKLSGTGVYLKVNSVLRAVGNNLIDDIHGFGLRVFADLKLIDIPETLANDGEFLREAGPDIVTVMCSAGMNSMQALKVMLPGTEVLGVTVLTSQTDEDTHQLYQCPVGDAVLRLVQFGVRAKVDGFISSPAEAGSLCAHLHGTGMTINTPAIRPLWSIVKNDDQNQKRVMTPFGAIKAGADRIVVGRPITQSNDPRVAVLRTLEEIEAALKAR